MAISRFVLGCRVSGGFSLGSAPFVRALTLPFLALLLVGLSSIAHAADCPDADGDGYVVCGGCDVPAGKVCGDCNDGNAAINPAAAEICNGADDDCDGDVDLADSEFNDPDPVDGIDNDADDQLDEGFGYCLYATTGPADQCKTGGHLECRWPAGSVTEVTAQGTLTCVNLSENINQYEVESLAQGNCFDGVDNDCDTLTDIAQASCQEPETCDNIDNDGDGSIDEDFPLSSPGSLGDSCSAGDGECQRSGLYTCLGDGSDGVCSAIPGKPKKEGSTFGSTCDNGKDDDCDGLTDLADTLDCAGFGDPELCGNGIDDDGDGSTDEGFPTVGTECAVGVGACRVIGALQCSGDGLGTECGAVALAPPEASETSCGDFVDNDCDGLTDGDDPDCSGAVADLGVTCSLPYQRGKPGKDCNGKHEIRFSGGSATSVQADLLAFDTDGSLLGIIEDVQDGDEAHLASRVDPDDYKLASKTNKQGTRHEVFADRPLLRVTGTGPLGTQDVAYCGILPYLEVIEPQGLTISLSEGNEIDVKAQIPLVDVDTLQLKLDGVDLLAEALLDATTQFPTGDSPLCGSAGECVIQIEAGCGDGSQVPVEIRDLKVEGLDTTIAFDAKEGVATPEQVNTLSFKVIGLPPGGHIVYISASPLPLPKQLSSECLIDDLVDTGTASSFGIAVTSPADQQIVLSAPVTVAGVACGGNEIASLSINGKPVDVTIPTNQTCTPGDGMDVAPECYVNFSESMGERTLEEAAGGNAPVGTYLRGSNRVIAEAADDRGNRTFNTDVIFALGAVQQPVGLELAQLLAGAETAAKSLALPDQELDNRLIDQVLRPDLPRRVQRFLDETVDPTVRDTLWKLQEFLENEIYMALEEATVDTAFLAGLEESGAQDFFNSTCEAAIDTFTADMSANLSGETFGNFDVKPDCSCNLDKIPLVLENLSFTTWVEDNPNGPPTCEVDFKDGEINLVVHLPTAHLNVGADESCQDNGLFGECIARTKVDVEAAIDITDIQFDVKITESQIEDKVPAEDAFSFTYDIQDPDGTPLYAQAGSCDDPSGLECFNDNACWPVTGGGVCAKGANVGIECTSDSACPPAGDGLGNKCSGGENQGKGCVSNADCPGGACYAKCVGICDGEEQNNKDTGFDPVTKNDVGIECWGASICLVFDTVARAIGGAIAFVFTLGDFDVGNFIFQQFGVGGFEFEQDFLDNLQLGDPDAMGLGEIGLDADGFGQSSGNSSFTPGPIDVEMAENALTISFGAEFASQCDDPAIDETPGAALTPARKPTPQEVADAGAEVSVLIADDVFNQIFASMKECGQLRSFCTSDGDLQTVGDLLPDCETIPLPSAKGACQAIRGDDCTLLSQSVARGACHGFAGDDCSTLPLGDLGLVERQIVQNNCEETVARNIHASDAIQLCGKVDMDPELGVFDESASDKFVGLDVALKQTSVVFVLDRAQDGYTGELDELQGCSSSEGDAAPDCRLYATCLDLALKTELGIDNSLCAANELGFAAVLDETKPVVPSNLELGVMCNASASGADDSILASAFESIAVEKIAENAQNFAPPFCIDGLNLNGVLDFNSDASKLFGITTDGFTPGYADYLGITVDLQPLQ